jgi:aspartate/methionine/tyrosine aminotransferase
MGNQYSEIAEGIVPFLAMEIMERGFEMVRAGERVIQLSVGDPDFPPPPAVVEETARACRAGHTHYTDSRGVYALREAIAEDCLRRRGVEVSPEQVVVTSGVSPALLMVCRLLIENGDEILVPAPHYPCYPNMVSACGGRPVLIPTRAEDGYQLDVDRVRAAITPRTRGILLASPANPTGATQPEEVVRGLAELGIPVLSDEIYDGLLFEGVKAYSPLGMTDECFVFDGFSKRYAMTGFRLGYVIAPEKALRPLQSMQQNFFISAGHFVQDAAIVALEQGAEHIEMMRREYDRRRKLLVAGLRDLGLAVPRAPTGAFYVLADARRFGTDSLRLAFDILERAKVALVPGRDFGEAAEGFLRFCYATSYEDIEEGLQRLADALPALLSAGERGP